MAWKTNSEKKEITPNNNKELFQAISVAEKKRGLKIMCYGGYGTGKSHFALNSPGPVYIIDTENGVVPLAKHNPDAQILVIGNKSNDENAGEKAEVENWEKLNEAIEYILNPKNNIKPGTVVIDSLTDVWSWAQAWMKVKKFKIDIVDRPKQQWDWGPITAIFRSLITRLINQDFNVIFNARAKEIYSGPGQPSGQFEPATQKYVGHDVDFVLFMDNKFVNGKFNFTARINKQRGADKKLLGKVIENPTFDKLKEILENE